MGVDPETTSTSGTTGPGTTLGTTSTSDGTSTTTGEPIPCMPGDGMGMGPVDKSYIWIPSDTLGQISKISTLTLIEEARYRTGPQGGTESSSRTAVSADGRFVVVNARGTGRSTMFAANKADCIDNNGNGVIDTSANLNDILAWGQDECMLWSITHPVGAGIQAGPRGVTWTPGTWSFDECKYVDPKVWLGYRTGPSNQAHIVRIDGVSGIVEETVVVDNWVGSSYAPYGAALDPDFKPWFTGLRGELIRVNTENNPATLTRITAPNNIQAYGMTVDKDGNPWIGGCTGPVSTYDVQTAQWITIPGTNACHRGIGAGDDYVWVASNGPCGLVQIDRQTRTLVAKHTPPQCSTAIGISIDIEKYLWLVDQSGWAWKIDQDAVAWDQKVMVAGGHYVYSDMTGGQLLSVVPQ
ncbi:lyase [Nannocystis sp. ILAH1]|uniref:lyase n=1 Tax=Nannocystis sp. ILAH1 TaxID=2996789 RepID=UPI00226E924A|nr:lyase [Nannocystis sp. ILAH1]MCY0991760.1 lyase [Nannocystis sp. ILAH1]